MLLGTTNFEKDTGIFSNPVEQSFLTFLITFITSLAFVYLNKTNCFDYFAIGFS